MEYKNIRRRSKRCTDKVVRKACGRGTALKLQIGITDSASRQRSLTRFVCSRRTTDDDDLNEILLWSTIARTSRKEPVFVAWPIAGINVRDRKVMERNYLVDLSQSANIALHALCPFQYPAHGAPALIHYRVLSLNDKLSIIIDISPLLLVILHGRNSWSNEQLLFVEINSPLNRLGRSPGLDLIRFNYYA